MAVSDPVADFLTRIRNAIKAQHRYVDMGWSKMKQNIAEILKNQGFIENYLVKDDNEKRGTIRVFLEIYRWPSSCNSRIKTNFKTWFAQICWTSRYSHVFMVDMGVSIVSTSQGVMPGNEAQSERNWWRTFMFGLVTALRRKTMSRKGKLPIPLPKV